jgi:hypothetical protein
MLATLKHNSQLMPALKWPRLLVNLPHRAMLGFTGTVKLPDHEPMDPPKKEPRHSTSNEAFGIEAWQ